MAGTEFEGTEESSANVELRLITLELMKIAAKEKKSFEEIAERYISNVFILRKMLDNGNDNI